MRDDRERLLDIAEAIDRINRRVGTAADEFEQNEMLQVWVVHHLEIIGEVARGLSEEFRLSHPGYDWSRPIGLRNVLAHQYFEVDLGAVWPVVEKDLPELKLAIDAALGEAT